MVIIPKYQVGSIVFMLILAGLLNPLFTYFFFFNLFFSLMRLFPFFIIDLIGILLLRPYELIKTSDSYSNHDDLRKNNKVTQGFSE